MRNVANGGRTEGSSGEELETRKPTEISVGFFLCPRLGLLRVVRALGSRPGANFAEIWGPIEPGGLPMA